MKVYLAGPMSGIEHFNAPAFMAAERDLIAQGHEVYNPVSYIGLDACMAGRGEETNLQGFDRGKALLSGLVYICEKAEAIALLPGWANSSGATAEYAVAMALKLRVIYL